MALGLEVSGIRMKRARDIRFASRSAMPSSGGLMKSSAELIQRTGTVIRSSSGAGL
jgi:hypothetical protein